MLLWTLPQSPLTHGRAENRAFPALNGGFSMLNRVARFTRKVRLSRAGPRYCRNPAAVNSTVFTWPPPPSSGTSLSLWYNSTPAALPIFSTTLCSA